jgi:hypothetical protein
MIGAIKPTDPLADGPKRHALQLMSHTGAQ